MNTFSISKACFLKTYKKYFFNRLFKVFFLIVIPFLEIAFFLLFDSKNVFTRIIYLVVLVIVFLLIIVIFVKVYIVYFKNKNRIISTFFQNADMLFVCFRNDVFLFQYVDEEVFKEIAFEVGECTAFLFEDGTVLEKGSRFQKQYIVLPKKMIDEIGAKLSRIYNGKKVFLKQLSLFLISISIAFFFVCFSIIHFASEIAIFQNYMVPKYLWICFCFLGGPILNIIFGVVHRIKKFPTSKNIVFGSISLSLLLCAGFLSFAKPLQPVESTTFLNELSTSYNIFLPNKSNTIIVNNFSNNVAYSKILDKREELTFQNYLKTSPDWLFDLPDYSKQILPKGFIYYNNSYCYKSMVFVPDLSICNPTVLPEGEHLLIYIGYDKTHHSFRIITDYHFTTRDTEESNVY